MATRSVVPASRSGKAAAPAAQPLDDSIHARPEPSQQLLRSLLPPQPAAIPVHPPDKKRISLRQFQIFVKPRLKIGSPTDPLEKQADVMAERALGRLHAPGLSPAANATPVGHRLEASASSRPQPAQAGLPVLNSTGRPLDAEDRAFFEQRFGHDFSGVQVQSDQSANDSARSLGARAFTAGAHMVFGAGEYEPRTSTGRRLIAHELAHIVQQRRSPQSHALIQRKLIATGDAARFAAFANSIISVQFEVVIATSGEVSLHATNIAGPPTQVAQQLVDTLRSAINDPNTINIEFIHGRTSTRPQDAAVLIGSYGQSKIDLDDIVAAGTQGQGANGGSMLIHEITEQTHKQVQGQAYPAAHAAGIQAEEAAVGATRGTARTRQVNPTTIEVTIPYTYPDGHVVEVTLTIVNGNVTNVQRRTIPAPATTGGGGSGTTPSTGGSGASGRRP